MRKIIAFLTALCAFAIPASAQPTAEQQATSYVAAVQGAPSEHPVRLDRQVIGRNFFVVLAPNFRDPSRSRTQLNWFDFDIVYGIQTRCESQLRPQSPSAFRSIFMVALRNVPGTVIGTVLGARLGGFTGGNSGMGNYALYTGGAAIGGSIGAGINAHAMGRQTSIGGCVVMLMNEAHRVGMLRDVLVTYNTFPTRGPGIRRSSLRAPTTDELSAAGFVNTAASATTDTPPADLSPPPGN